MTSDAAIAHSSGWPLGAKQDGRMGEQDQSLHALTSRPADPAIQTGQVCASAKP
jgi:hypothetical protein